MDNLGKGTNPRKELECPEDPAPGSNLKGLHLKFSPEPSLVST